MLLQVLFSILQADPFELASTAVPYENPLAATARRRMANGGLINSNVSGQNGDAASTGGNQPQPAQPRLLSPTDALRAYRRRPSLADVQHLNSRELFPFWLIH